MPPKKGKGKGKPQTPPTPTPPSQPPPLSRNQRVIMTLGLEEISPNLRKMSDGDLQVALTRFLHYAERHTELGIKSENFKITTLPGVEFSQVVMTAPLRSPLLEPYLKSVTVTELNRNRLTAGGGDICLDEYPMDSDDFLGCRYFIRYLAEVVEDGYSVVLLQDENQSVALLVHVKMIRKLNGDPGTALLQVEYICTSKADVHVKERVKIVEEFISKPKCITIPGTEHQIQLVKLVLQAHERFLDETVISEHDKEWNPKHKFIRPSFLVPLYPIPGASQLRIIQEIKGLVTPASDSAEPTGPSNQNNFLPSGASVLINPMRDWDGAKLLLISPCEVLDGSPKTPNVNHMPDHKEGEIFVIKAQAGTQGDCLIYDREQSFLILAADPQDELRAAIKAVADQDQNLVKGKAYFYAQNEDDKLRVYLEDHPEQYRAW